MANLTLVIDDEVLRRARIRALEQGTSVNAVVRQILEDYAGRSAAGAAMARFTARARDASAGSGPQGRRWTRDELHDRASLR
jgi:plasmid stability protein